MKNLDNTMSESKIHATVMSRVHTIYFFQSPVTTLTSAAVIFILAMWGIGREVWVARVFQNMPSLVDWDAVLRFYLTAFLDTRFIVQVLSVIAIGAFVWLVANIVRVALTIRTERGVGQFA